MTWNGSSIVATNGTASVAIGFTGLMLVRVGILPLAINDGLATLEVDIGEQQISCIALRRVARDTAASWRAKAVFEGPAQCLLQSAGTARCEDAG